MDTETSKTKPLSKEETKGLLSLIEGSKIINNNKTNATNNKLKVEEWRRIAGVFNATMSTCRRTPQQLRLKWENLKKNSRKRSTLIRLERIKTGDGPPGYFPPDDILDRVAAILGSARTGGSIKHKSLPQKPLPQKPLPQKPLPLKPDNGCQARNIALAEYYTVKKKLLESKFENIMLENEKLRLEIRKLKEEDF